MRVTFLILLGAASLTGQQQSAGPRWTLLQPQAYVSAGGATLTRQDDHSVLASGANPDKDTYTITARNELRGVTAFRIEFMADPSFPASGPGRAENGNVVLSEIRIEAAGKPAAFQGGTADFEQAGWFLDSAFDGKAETGWAVAPEFGKSHHAVVVMKAPLTAESITFMLEFQSANPRHVAGRVRLSATTDKIAPRSWSSELPEDIQAILEIAPARRSGAQKDALADSYGKRADAAVKKGIDWLKAVAEYPKSHAGVSDELVLWTFVHAGVPENDPKFQELLKRMLEAPLDRTYRVALQAMILEELERVRHQARIAQCAQFLVDNQCKNGQWHYGEPTDSVKAIPEDRREIQTGRVREFGTGSWERRKKPKVVKHIAVKKNRDGPESGDNSNAQYAALGLRSCWEAGVMIPKDVLTAARNWWVASQHADPNKDNGYGGVRGWGYKGAAEGAPYGSMTAGGLGSLVILDHMLDVKWEPDPAVKAGLNWIASRFSVADNPGVGPDQYYYYLYGLERAGILYGTEKFGRHEWYPQGAQMLFKRQAADGSWDGQVWHTCFAILFLRRATRPLEDVASEDPYRRRR